MYTELQVEWGLTDEQFDSIDVAKIRRVLEFRAAKGEGEKIAADKRT